VDGVKALGFPLSEVHELRRHNPEMIGLKDLDNVADVTGFHRVRLDNAQGAFDRHSSPLKDVRRPMQNWIVRTSSHSGIEKSFALSMIQ
jgi:hypothetical protein